ncbi:MAG: hypothetical protein RCG15_07720 [Candidatus Rickettsia vulgarisii]
MLAYPGVSQRVPSKHIDKDVIGNYKIVFSEGYLWKDIQDNSKIITEFFKNAKNSGSLTAFTFGDQSRVKRHREEWLKLLKEVDIIFSDQ